MGSISIQGLLDAYKTRFRAPQGVVVAEVVVVCGEVGVVCSVSDFAYTPSTKTIAITINGPKKIELLMRKQEILTKLQTKLRAEDCPRDLI
jgi:hypothetical protein